MLWSIAHTHEVHREELDAIYGEHLGRTTDPYALYWHDGANEGRFPMEWALQNVLASAEHQRLHRGERGLVPAWYRAALGKDAASVSDGALRYWTGRVRAVGRLAALREMYCTPEAVTRRVTLTDDDLLGRGLNRGAVAYWSPREVESTINAQVLIGATAESRRRPGDAVPSWP